MTTRRLAVPGPIEAALRAVPFVRRPRLEAGDLLHAALADPGRYARQIERLHERHLHGRGAHEIREGPVSLATLAVRRDEVARVFAATVASGEYRFGPGVPRTIRVGGRRRTVYAFGLSDLVVQGVICTLLEAALEPTLSPSLASYRPGMAWWSATRRLAAFVRVHRRERPDPRTRGLYVLRRDVAAYTDSIPVGEDSPIWPEVRQLLESVQAGAPLRSADWRLVQDVVRPEIARSDGTVGRLERGVPTGQPVSTLAFNLYLRDLDHELAEIPGGFYARYSDDIAFAHTDPDVARAAAQRVAAVVEARGLTLNDAKSRDLYVTAAGRASNAWPGARPTDHITFLGLRVDATGAIGLDGPKAREVVRDIGRRIRAVSAHADTPQARRELAAAVVRRALQPDEPVRSTRTASLLHDVVTDRRQLAELDRRIALVAAEALTGRRGPRAMRSIPPRLLREAGLPSLVAVRNRAPSGPRRAGRP